MASKLTTHQRASVAGYMSWARCPDRSARARRAYETRMRNLERVVDPDGVMSASDRRKAAESYLRAQMTRVSAARTRSA